MFGISYNTWKATCQMYFNLSDGELSSYLQWFPFTKLSAADQAYIASKLFYRRYINTGAFTFFPPIMHQSENYMQKGDGSFRDSSLLSPVLYLILQAIGKEVSSKYSVQRRNQIDVFYAGNYTEMRPKYKRDYDDFFKTINSQLECCNYFIKTDLSNFFQNIDVDILISRIDSICNKHTLHFTQTQLFLFKELLLYCGGGRFPLVENSVASSYLATIIYLDEIDERLASFIDNKISVFTSYKIVRYVDDMYILISSEHSEAEIHAAYNQIRNEYSSILKEYGLALNTKKCCVKPAFEIHEELKKSLYDEQFHGEKHQMGELFSGALGCFLKDISKMLFTDFFDVDKYNDLIERHFGNDTIEFTATEVFNYFVYEDTIEVRSSEVVSEIIHLINQDISFISFDPKRLSVLIIKTQSTQAIKALLNQLFQRNRAGMWNSYDTIVAISYLTQSGFRHIDLINVLGQHSTSLSEFYNHFCQTSFATVMNALKPNSYCDIVDQDWKACFLYFMYWIAKSRHNNLEKFAYYKNFFDRFTADLAFSINYESDVKRPNYKLFYKEAEHKKFFSPYSSQADKIIKKAHSLRNANPLSHASAELIDNDSTSTDIENSIRDMETLINIVRTMHGL